MFVSNNSIQEVRNYFNSELKNLFSERELKSIAKQFICKRLGWSNSTYMLAHDATVSESDLLYFRGQVKRLLAGEPFQYVLGETYFYNILLETTSQALIPRPETEELVDWVLQELPEKSQQILDIGTGTGCIPLALKKARLQDEVQGIDFSKEAIQLAQKNAQALSLDVTFGIFDILKGENDPSVHKDWDVIISNPPYIPDNERAKLSDHVIRYEPNEALFVPTDNPLLFYERIAIFAKANLSEKGMLFFEIHEELGKDTVSLLERAGFKTMLKKDLQGKDRMIKATLA